MIRAVMGNEFGIWLKATRESTLDPLTDRPFTQKRLAELTNISSSKVAAWERGQISSVSPEDAHALARVLRRSQREILQALGYEVDETPLTPDEKELLETFRRLPSVHKLLEKERLRTLLPLLQKSGSWLGDAPAGAN